MRTPVVASRARFVVVVLALYAACRAVTTVVLWLAMQRQVPTGMTGGDDVPVTYFPFTALWDGQWYERIAEDGYPSSLPTDADGRVRENPWAFYPLFPVASRAVMTLTGLDFPVAASTLALAAGFGAAVLMGLLLRDRIGDVPTFAVVVLWASFPASVTLQLSYTESFAMLLLVAYLYLLSREQWLAATSVALLVGLTRPIAIPLGVVTLVVVALRWRARDRRPLAVRDRVEMLVALAGCGVAGLLWPAVAWWGTGSRTAYTDTMAAWRAYDEVEPFAPWLDKTEWFLDQVVAPAVGAPGLAGWAPAVLVTTVVVLVAMVAGPWASALGADLRTWSLAYPAYLAAVLDPFTSIVRYLVPLFPLLAVMIGVGWRDGRGNGTVRVLARTVPLLVLFVWWQWWWTDTLWRFVPPSDYPP